MKKEVEERIKAWLAGVELIEGTNEISKLQIACLYDIAKQLKNLANTFGLRLTMAEKTQGAGKPADKPVKKKEPKKPKVKVVPGKPISEEDMPLGGLE